jgi:hypothetical protein
MAAGRPLPSATVPVKAAGTAAYAFYERWNNRGLPQELVRRLPENLRER